VIARLPSTISLMRRPSTPISMAKRFWLKALLDRAIEKGGAFGRTHNGLWFDVGTPPAVKRTEMMLASE